MFVVVVSNSRNLGMLYKNENTTETTIRGVFKRNLFKGYQMAKYLSMVTERVIKTEPTRPMCATPKLQ